MRKATKKKAAKAAKKNAGVKSPRDFWNQLVLLEKTTANLARQAEVQAEAQAKRDEEQTKRAEEQAKRDEELTKRIEEQTKQSEELTKRAVADQNRLARLEAALAKDRVNNENHRRNSSRVLENAFAGSLPRVMGEAHDISIDPKNVLLRVRRGRNRLEYDFVAPNGEVVLVGEVKTRLTLDDVLRFAGTLRGFRRDYPEYANLKLHGVVAGGVVEDKALEQAVEEGFFVLRMEGGEAHPATARGFQPAAY